ncbi:uncharacterized protein LOC129764528 [Toxorhynchites rutilus septentrionalis]|uniref:uncharacterized protein LOC129764528 n=1 Tax=Toxorhynchites rutilus septentrionalis TaxID=329112 RepID=UPI00247A03B3|nr:uncharacterized protein LOC129764528 [Toxorhynchites rutilus septentrionalis]
MRQIGIETDDPLKRIQEEINEVVRREQELRQGHRLNDSNDDCHSSVNSDDSGLSLSLSPVHSPSVSNLKHKIEASTRKFTEANDHDIRTTGDRQTVSSQSNVLIRARSTPQLCQVPMNRRFNVHPNQRGMMQKFIETRGRLNKLPTTLNGNMSTNCTNENHMVINEQYKSPIELNRPNFMLSPTAVSAQPIIERDSNGKPIRRGYVPVEEKIQKELRDLKNREGELKRLRKQSRVLSQSDLLELNYESDSGEFLSDDDCSVYPVSRKLRPTKSIGELCEALTNSSLSPRETPSPQMESRHRSGGLRPAVSLAQLCDVDPEEAPSSHKLIAKWENLIQQKLQR